MAEACGSEITERLMLPTVLTMASDAVANVRFNVAKTLTVVGPKLGGSVMQSQIKPCLTKLNDDTDFDVRFFASEAALGEKRLAVKCPCNERVSDVSYLVFSMRLLEVSPLHSPHEKAPPPHHHLI